MNYGLTQMRKGELDTAIKYFEMARETGYGKHPYLYINLGLAYDALGRADQAESYYKLALQQGPGYPDTHYYYGRWLLEKGDKAQAIQKLKRALELSPAHNKAKFLLDRAGNVPPKELLEQAKARAADNPTPENYLELSLQYYNNQLFEESIDAANRALQRRPDYAAAYNNVCAARIRLERWDEAIDACNRALKLKPNYELARGNLNWALYEKNKANQSR
jgi:tetratricopeptide (TPR) repeat protein